jgi:WD repeat-containing protein 61
MKLKPSKKIDTAHTDCISSLTWSQGDLITGSLDGFLKLWSINPTVTTKFCSTKQKMGVSSLAASSDQSVVAVCYQNSIIRFYDVQHKLETGFIDPGLLEAWSICLSPDDDVLVSGNARGAVNIWSMQAGHDKLATLETQNKFILSTAFSADGKLATAGLDGVVNLIDLKTQQILHKLDAHAVPIRSVCFSPDGDLLYTASDDRHVSIYSINTGTLVNSFSHPGMVFSVDSSPNKRHFAVGCSDYSVNVWDLGMQKLLEKFETHADQVWSVKYDKLTGSLASAGDDCLLQIYE